MITLPTRLGVFDLVIFNHPHCGVDVPARNRALLSHFIASARSVLRDEKSRIVVGARPLCKIRLPSTLVGQVTLCAQQPEQWGIHDVGQRHNFSLALSVPFVPLEWPGMLDESGVFRA